MMDHRFEVFVNEDDAGKCVAVMLRGTAVVEFEGELVPILGITPEAARRLAADLTECADRIEARK